MDDPQFTRPLAQVLRSAATELAELAALADHLECALPSAEGLLDLGLAERFQAADLLTQRLSGLTLLFDALADAAPRDVALDVRGATDTLKLAEQARRFLGHAPTTAVASGEVLLFGD